MPPTFKPDFQRILLKNKKKILKMHILYGAITLYGATFQKKLQLNTIRLKKFKF